MRSGAGDAFSRRRWPLPTMSSSVFISLIVSRFISRVLRSRSVLLTGERCPRRSLRWRQELWFVVFTAVLLTAPPLWWVSSPTMSREGSLTTVVLWFTGTFPGEPLSGCRRTSHTVDFFLALLLLTESLVTISQLPDFVVKALQTHSSIVLSPLSFSYEDLSCLISFIFVVYCLFPRGCLIPSCLCSS
ncbi:hypothetical protein YC2023_007797 [Brassica napus]